MEYRALCKKHVIKISKQDLARICCFALFTPSKLLPWSKGLHKSNGSVDDNDHSSLAKRLLTHHLERLYTFSDGSKAPMNNTENAETQLLRALIDFAFHDIVPPGFNDTPDEIEDRKKRFMLSLGEVVGTLFGGHTVSSHVDYVKITPDDQLPSVLWNVWAPFMSAPWPKELETEKTTAPDLSCKDPRIAVNRILLRNSITQVGDSFWPEALMPAYESEQILETHNSSALLQ